MIEGAAKINPRQPGWDKDRRSEQTTLVPVQMFSSIFKNTSPDENKRNRQAIWTKLKIVPTGFRIEVTAGINSYPYQFVLISTKTATTGKMEIQWNLDTDQKSCLS